MEKGEVQTQICGTIEYMAPEVVQNGVHSNKVDVWSLGILLYEMTTGRTPFNAHNIR